MNTFGGKLRNLRIKFGLSQLELAEQLNETYGSSINKSMISKWENGLGEPRLETARLLAKFFGVSLDELLDLPTDDVDTIAAHHEGEDWTEEELKEIERFKEFIRSKRNQQG